MSLSRSVLLGLAGLLFLLTTALHWPGELTPDASNQLAQAKVLRFTDWHPPLMAMLWSLWPRPEFMLVLQNALHWLGIGLLASRLPKRWGLVVLAVGLTPIAFKYLGVLQKDTLLASFFVAAFGVASKQIGVALGVLGALTRANGPFALIGLLPLRLPFSVILAVAMVPAAMALNRAVSERTYVERALPFYDMAGIAHFTGDRTRFPEGCYTPLFWDTLGTERCNFAYDRAAKSLTREWLSAIASHPIAYAQHRLTHFNYSIFFLVPPMQQCVEAPDMHQCDGSLLKDAITKNAFLWPITWLVAGLLLLLARPNHLSRNLTLSGLAFGFAYAVVGVASDFRYFYWTELAVQLAIVIHFASGGRLPWKLWAPVIGSVWAAGYAARLLL